MSKQDRYESLVQERKNCAACVGLVNPANHKQGVYDSCHIGSWTRWQGDLNALVMVVGQDWGDTRCFEVNKGREPKGIPTNKTLQKLLASVGIAVESPDIPGQKQVAFFTNAILCLKEGGLGGKVRTEWFKNCSGFLRQQVELVSPRVVVTLGEKAFRALVEVFELELEAKKFKEAVENPNGFLLPNGSVLVPVYHCGARILNTHRPLPQQIEDWRRVKSALKRS